MSGRGAQGAVLPAPSSGGAWTRLFGFWRSLFGGRQYVSALPAPQAAYVATVEAGEGQPTQPVEEQRHLPSRSERINRRNPAARIIAAFDSSHPVEERDRLHGRDEMLDSLFEAVLFNRQHAIIHGARGSGKTSLARIFGDYADQQGGIVIYTACEASASFAELLRPYLSFIPPSCIPFASQSSFDTERASLPESFGPRVAVDLLSRLDPDSQIILIFDEFDRVNDADVHAQMATFMKLLSDARLPIQVLIVGIAGTVDDLIDCHPSLRRHMLPISIGRISPADTLELIETGSKRAGIGFDDDSKQEIVAMSCGSPYHVQLFCYVAAIEAARQGVDQVDLQLCHRGAMRAFETWATLNQRDSAYFRSLARESEDNIRVIRAAAREAAIHDTLSADAPGVELLAPALKAEGQSGRMSFRDSAAPQFLLAITSRQHARPRDADLSSVPSRERAA